MNDGKTPWVTKLILLAVLLNSACLILLLVEQNSKTPLLSRLIPSGSQPEQNDLQPQTFTPPTRLPSPGKPASIPGSVTPPHQIGDRPAFPVSEEGPVDTGIQLVQRTLISEEIPVAASGRGTARSGASLSGRVWLLGTPPPETVIAMDAMCGQLQTNPVTTRHYLVTDDGRLANVFVWIQEGLENFRFPIDTNRPALDNVNCLFQPYVMGLQAGQTFSIRNSDPFLHNVHATGRSNHEFNIGLPSQGSVVQRSFSVPEIFVRVKCDVHPWMFAYIGVVSHPFFAITDPDGVFHFARRLPSGRYTVAARHIKAGEARREIVIETGGSQVIEFTLEVPTS